MATSGCDAVAPFIVGWAAFSSKSVVVGLRVSSRQGLVLRAYFLGVSTRREIDDNGEEQI
ncbi:hypothetical protein [Bartonella sp. CB178]|uniref:hypothetical protein n=1 Tax=Bartonella sp. CB178 TaxID=3112255 RepID=UPI00300E31D4